MAACPVSEATRQSHKHRPYFVYKVAFVLKTTRWRPSSHERRTSFSKWCHFLEKRPGRGQVATSAGHMFHKLR